MQFFPDVIEIGRYSDGAGHEFSLVIDRRSPKAPVVFDREFERPLVHLDVHRASRGACAWN